MNLKIVGILVALLVGAILLSALLPTALNSIYDVKTATNNQANNLDANGKAIATDLNVTNDDASIAIFNLFPLFAVLGGLGIMAAFVYKNYNI